MQLYTLNVCQWQNEMKYDHKLVSMPVYGHDEPIMRMICTTCRQAESFDL